MSIFNSSMTPKQVIDFFGNANKAAKAIGLTRVTVGVWKKTDYVPYATQLRIERLTGGELKADEITVTVDDILRLFGNIDGAARALFITPDVVRKWQKRGAIPFYFHRTILARMNAWTEESKKI